jgi:hypothetical protein
MHKLLNTYFTFVLMVAANTISAMPSFPLSPLPSNTLVSPMPPMPYVPAITYEKIDHMQDLRTRILLQRFFHRDKPQR